jgi:hypothetical protein
LTRRFIMIRSVSLLAQMPIFPWFVLLFYASGVAFRLHLSWDWGLVFVLLRDASFGTTVQRPTWARRRLGESSTAFSASSQASANEATRRRGLGIFLPLLTPSTIGHCLPASGSTSSVFAAAGAGARAANSALNRGGGLGRMGLQWSVCTVLPPGGRWYKDTEARRYAEYFLPTTLRTTNPERNRAANCPSVHSLPRFDFVELSLVVHDCPAVLDLARMDRGRCPRWQVDE